MTADEKLAEARKTAEEKRDFIISRYGDNEIYSSPEYLEMLTQEIMAQMNLEEFTFGLAQLHREAETEQKNLTAIGTSRTQPNIIKNLINLYDTTIIAACQ